MRENGLTTRVSPLAMKKTNQAQKVRTNSSVWDLLSLLLTLVFLSEHDVAAQGTLLVALKTEAT